MESICYNIQRCYECKSHEVSQTVLGTQHAFYMKITEKTQRKCRKISNAVYKENVAFGRGKVERKVLVQEQLQWRWKCRERVNWLRPHVKAMNYYKTV